MQTAETETNGQIVRQAERQIETDKVLLRKEEKEK